MWLMMPPLSTTASAPTSTTSTLSIKYAAAQSRTRVQGMPASDSSRQVETPDCAPTDIQSRHVEGCVAMQEARLVHPALSDHHAEVFSLRCSRSQQFRHHLQR